MTDFRHVLYYCRAWRWPVWFVPWRFMKKCPFCAEEIQDAAIKCKHCGEFLNDAARMQLAQKKEKPLWFFRTSFIVMSFCCAGPLALPLIWFRPKTHWVLKTVWTVVILVITWFMFRIMKESVHNITEYYNLIQ